MKVNDYNFIYSGVEGIYVLDRVAFKDKFDEDGNNDWEKSSGKKKLQEWAEENLTKEILEQFDVDIPAIEEVFSQKMFNLWGDPAYKLISEQLLIFQNSDNRMMEFEGRPLWWWMRSAYAGDAYRVWNVDTDGGMYNYGANFTGGFVPVLRRRKRK